MQNQYCMGSGFLIEKCIAGNVQSATIELIVFSTNQNQTTAQTVDAKWMVSKYDRLN